MYAKDGGKVPDPILKLTWGYINPNHPTAEEMLREINGRALVDVVDPKDPTKVLVKAGEQMPGFGLLQADGSTACGNWIYSGVWTQAGNMSARRDTSDPGNMGNNLPVGLCLAGQPARALQPCQRRPLQASRGIRPGPASAGPARPGPGSTSRTSRRPSAPTAARAPSS